MDKLVKVWLKDGSENWLLLHIEVQAQEEGNFPLRMFVYNCRIVDRYNREVISVAVLGDDRPGWRPNLYRTTRWGCRKEFEFPIAKLLDWLSQADELAVSPNPVARIVLAHLRALETTRRPEERKNRKFELVRQLYETGMQAEDVRKLFRLIDWMMTLPKELQRQFREDVHQLEEKMPYITDYERLAIEEGYEMGKKEWYEKGKREALVEAIRVYFTARFQQSAANLMDEIQRIENTDVLSLSAVYDCQTVEDAQKLIASWIRSSQPS